MRYYLYATISVTVIMLWLMIREWSRSQKLGDYGAAIGSLISLFWFIPILFVWLVYFIIRFHFG